MIRLVFQRLALILFAVYLAVFPGSTIIVALDRVPAWGAWMGSALLLLQGMAALCWLLGSQGRRGALAAPLIFLLAWAVEYLGVTTGFPFGRYHYTEALQPQLFGVVPLAIPCAWLMVVVGAWQLATPDNRRPTTDDRRPMTDQRLIASLVVGRWSVVKAATLVLLLDLQIETVATRINRYWTWIDSGPYYGVPTANFVAWWLAGLGMAFLVAKLLPEARRETRRQGDQFTIYDLRFTIAAHRASRFTFYVLRFLPSYLYLLSTLMFAVVNLARGYIVAGLIGVLVLLAVGWRWRG